MFRPHKDCIQTGLFPFNTIGDSDKSIKRDTRFISQRIKTVAKLACG